MKAGRARATAVDWVRRQAAAEPGFLGAYFSGSILELPDEAEVPVGSDVDLMVVSTRQDAPQRTKFLLDGVLIEATRLPWRLFASLETVPSAHSLRLESIVADTDGRLARVRAALVRDFAEPSRVLERCRSLRERTESGLSSLDGSAPWPDLVMDWTFKTSWTALLPLLAAVRNPTVRLRYLAEREVLAERGLIHLHPRLLELLGCRDLERERAQRHLDQLSVTFDLAVSVARTGFPFSSDVTSITRPIAIDGTREQIMRGNHREVVFWLLVTSTRCHKILAADAPELERERAPALEALLADLGVQSPADLQRRAAAALAFLPALWEAVERIVAGNGRGPAG